jgi:hypothetical protein
MKDEIVSYREMCDSENVQTLQRGMNYRLNSHYSVILLSQRKNAPYNDKICTDGMSIEYEGHDAPRSDTTKNPKRVDQPRETKTGSLTQNGMFAKAVDDYKSRMRQPEIVRAYEKLFNGVWSDKGFFELIDYRYEKEETGRRVFIFRLTESLFDLDGQELKEFGQRPRSRIIPSEIKKQVWIRDKGRCVICGSTDELHFDHDLPYSKGGSSITAGNVRILCARHNLEKSNKIQ